MPKLSKAAQDEIREAIRIVKEDKAKSNGSPNPAPPPEPPMDGAPPPDKTPKTDEPPKNVRPGLWWGTRLHDTGE